MTDEKAHVHFTVFPTRFQGAPCIEINCEGGGYFVAREVSHLLKNLGIEQESKENMLQIHTFPRTDKGIEKIVEGLERLKNSEYSVSVSILDGNRKPCDAKQLSDNYTAMQITRFPGVQRS